MNYLALSALMLLVTFIPRVLPGFLLDKLRLGKKATKFLNLIPYTAMSALIFPGVISVDAGNWWIGVVVMAVVLMFMAIFSLMLNGNKTESIAENNSKDYKTYSERKEEKKILEESQEEAELPQIKSFKK